MFSTKAVARIIYAYDYNLATRTARNRRTFVKVPANQGLPDAPAVDAAGFVWSAQRYDSCVARYDPDGALERRIDLPAKQTSAVAFGGEDPNGILITSASRSEPMPVLPPCYDPLSGPLGRQVFHLVSDIQGQPAYRTTLGGACTTPAHLRFKLLPPALRPPSAL